MSGVCTKHGSHYETECPDCLGDIFPGPFDDPHTPAMRGITDPEEARAASDAQRDVRARHVVEVEPQVDVGVRPPLPEPVHLGDGVYASFDGFHVNLAVNDHRNHAVALDPYVLRHLISYATRIGAV